MYCSSADVRKRNKTLLAEGKVSDPDVDEQILYASSVVDGVLANRYPDSLSSVPPIIKGITADIAASELLSSIVGNAGDDEEPTQADSLRKKAMDLLDRIGDGRIDLKVGSAPVKSAVRAKSTTYGQASVFGNWTPTYGG